MFVNPLNTHNCCRVFFFTSVLVFELHGKARKLQSDYYWKRLITDDESVFGIVASGNANSRRKNQH